MHSIIKFTYCGAKDHGVRRHVCNNMDDEHKLYDAPHGEEDDERNPPPLHDLSW